MKGNINLKEFISQVSKELRDCQSRDPENAFLELTGVTLEVSFTLDSSAKGSGKFIVVDVGVEARASQVHRVTLQLDPKKQCRQNRKPNAPSKKPISRQDTGPMYDHPGEHFGISGGNTLPNLKKV